MESVLQSLPKGGRVAVIRLRSLGDCVLTTPALELLRRGRPDLQIAVVVEYRFRSVFEGNPDIDAILEPGMAALRNWRPQLVLDLHGGSRSAVLTGVSGAPWRAGFGHFRYGLVYNVKIPRAQEVLGVSRKVHTAEHLASAIFHLGVPAADIPRAKLSGEQSRTAGPYAVIHAMASEPGKTWQPERFLGVAEHLQRSLDLEPIFIAGAGEDLQPFRAYRTLVGAPLAAIKTLLRGASVFIGNDSGPAHMAAAFGLPVVVLFGSSDPAIWGPWKTASEVIVGDSGIGSIQEQQVLDALERLRVHA